MNNFIHLDSHDKKKIEELANRFASKVPKETTFNNNKSKKYFESKQQSPRKESLSSKDTVKMSFRSGRKSNYSNINSEYSDCIIVI